MRSSKYFSDDRTGPEKRLKGQIPCIPLEFGSQILVFSDAQISKLEKLQGQALRRMLGFHQSVKYETVLAISGLTKMKYRFMQLQLQFWNRVKHVLDPNLYVSKIFMHNLTLARTRGVQPGFCAHLHKLATKLNSERLFTEATRNYDQSVKDSLFEPSQNRGKSFKTLTVQIQGMCRKLNTLEVTTGLRHSALYSTGQAERLYGLVQVTVKRNAVLLAADAAFGAHERNLRTIYLRVVSGADFITPFNYRRCPTCKFCGAENIRTEHLLFDCPNLAGNGSIGTLPTFLLDFLDGWGWGALESYVEFLFENKMWEELLAVCLGACFWSKIPKIHGLEDSSSASSVDDEKRAIVRSPNKGATSTRPRCFMQVSTGNGLENFPVTREYFTLEHNKPVCLAMIHGAATRLSKVKELWDNYVKQNV